MRENGREKVWWERWKESKWKRESWLEIKEEREWDERKLMRENSKRENWWERMDERDE